MSAGRYRDEPLREHDRTLFRCGSDALDSYFRAGAGQDRRRNLAVPYVLVEVDTADVVGFYTLSAFSVSTRNLPGSTTRRLPPYQVFPALLIGRLAVDMRHQGQGVGRLLLAAALRRCLALSQSLGALAVVVDAKDDSAAVFYRHAGFLPLADHPDRFYIPMRSVSRALSS